MEIINTRNVVLVTVLSGALALAGCSKSSEAAVDLAADEPKISTTFYPNGTRLTQFSNERDQYADVLAYCDGPDLVEQTDLTHEGYAGAGNAIERTPNHSACADGRLDPSDFPQ